MFGFIDPFTRTGGTFAEFAAVPVEFAHRLPDELVLFRDAAALACVGATAVTLCNLGHVAQAAGYWSTAHRAVSGTWRCRLPSARGAIVTATASAARHDFVRSLGAAACIDYRHRADATMARRLRRRARLRAEHSTRRAAHDCCTRRGHYVTTVPGAATFLLDPLTNRFGGVQRHGVMLKPDAGVMNEVLGYVAQGRLHCAIEQEFPLQRGADRDRALPLGAGAGKDRAPRPTE